VSGLAFSPDQVSSTQAFYDPSDLSSLYQSRTGGDIVSADGQTVGIMLDKSQMGSKTAAAFIAGADELVVNGDGSNTTGWSVSAGTLTSVDGRLRFTTDSTAYASRSFATVIGQWYLLTGYCGRVSAVANFYAIRKSDTANATTNIVTGTQGTSTGEAAYTPVFFQATATTTYVILQNNTAAVGSIVDFSDISIKALPGYHALAPSDAARPLYKTAANTGKAGYAAAMAAQPELVTNGQFATDTVWTKSANVVISGGEASVAGGSGGAGIYQALSVQNKLILVTYTIVRNTMNQIVYPQTCNDVGGSNTVDTGESFTTLGTHSALLRVGNATGFRIRMQDNLSGDIAIDNVSVKEVPAAYLHRYVDYDGVDDVLNATLPDLGSTASVWYMKQDGTAVYAANQSISGAYALPAVDMRGLIIVDGPISASDQTKLATYYA
jgi:hypothetical protein